MGQKLSTDVPVPKSVLTPQWPSLNLFREKEKEYKKVQKQIYDQRHKTRPLDPLLPDAPDHLYGLEQGMIAQYQAMLFHQLEPQGHTS